MSRLQKIFKQADWTTPVSERARTTHRSHAPVIPNAKSKKRPPTVDAEKKNAEAAWARDGQNDLLYMRRGYPTPTAAFPSEALPSFEVRKV